MTAPVAKADGEHEAAANEVDEEDDDDAAKSGATEDLTKAELPDALAKALQDRDDRIAAQNAEMIQTVASMAELLGAVSKRVEDIAAQPMPPLTMAKGTVITEKGGRSDDGPSAEEIAAAIAKMSPEQIQLSTLKGKFMEGPDPVLTQRFGGKLWAPQT